MDEAFESELQNRRAVVQNYIMSRPYVNALCPGHIHDAAFHALGSGGKSLRPALLLFACGVVGGDEGFAIPAAAAIEMTHTWTLIHDDVIDRDPKRRGRESIHEEFRRRAIVELGFSDDEAKHYGTSIAILSGDLLQSWVVSLLCELAGKCSPGLTLYIINELMTKVPNSLCEGEILDVQYSKMPVEEVSELHILNMLQKKTAVLYEYAGRVGAMIGTGDPGSTAVTCIAQFAQRCGLAFQLQDDILGVIGNEQMLGKPVGADLREGKKTVIVREAYMNATPKQRSILRLALGNPEADEEEVTAATDLLVELGGVRRAQFLAKLYIDDAIGCLNGLDSLPYKWPYKQLLVNWAEYLIDRGA